MPYFRAWLLAPVLEVLDLLIGTIMTTTAETVATIEGLTAQVVKVRSEFATKVQALQDQIASGGMTAPEIVAALGVLKAELQVSDDQVPDAPVAEPVVPTE